MNILERISIKKGLLLGFFVMVLLLVTIVLSTIYQLHKTSSLSDDITELRAPTVFASSMMRKGVVHALAALRAGIILSDDKFKNEREEVWRTEIEPALEELRYLSTSWTVAENIERLDKIEALLPQFKHYQQEIEAITRLDENIPSVSIFTHEITPDINIMRGRILELIRLEMEEGAKENLLTLTQINETLVFLLTDLNKLILTGDKEFNRSYQLHWAEHQIAFDKLKQAAQDFNEPQQTVFKYFTIARDRFQRTAPAMLKMRGEDDWNLAHYWLATRVAPIGLEIEGLLDAMQASQQAVLVTDSKLLHQTLNEQIKLSWVLLFVAMIVSLLFTYVLRFMLTLLSDLSHSATTLSKGEEIFYENAIRRDEFGQIAKSLQSLNSYLIETSTHATQVAEGNYDIQVHIRSKNDALGAAMGSMRASLITLDSDNKKVAWLHQGRTLITDSLSNIQAVEDMGYDLLSLLCQYVVAEIGSIYQWKDAVSDELRGQFHQISSYAYKSSNGDVPSYYLGESLIGQAGKENEIVVINELPKGYIQVESSLGGIAPKHLVIIPFSYQGKVQGVLELGFINQITDASIELFELLQEPLGIAFESVSSRTLIERGLNEARTLALEVSRNEAHTSAIVDSSVSGIITINKEGLIQSFNASAERLFLYDEQDIIGQDSHVLLFEHQQEGQGYYAEIAKSDNNDRDIIGLRKDGAEFHMHLVVTEMNIDDEILLLAMVTDITEQVHSREHILEANEELQANSEELQAQQEELRVINEELVSKSKALELTRQQTELKAQELEEASRYKSEFLANMSHELRTPLNSLLILSGSLAENDEGNLSTDEIESATVIQDSGKHLLSLINDILDLSKVEAGKMTADNKEINLSVLKTALNSRFKHMAEEKALNFQIKIAKNVPAKFISDEVKLNQILTNLLSNAIKFTARGKVVLNIEFVTLDDAKEMLYFAVTDSGIGIAQSQYAAVFEAFQQADGSTSREYGGTGLGLSIARTFAELLQGSIELTSELGKGSTFILQLPLKPIDSVVEESGKQASPVQHNIAYELKNTPAAFKDDRDALDNNKPLFIIIEDDETFAKILFDTCHDQQAQALVAPDGETGIYLAKTNNVTGIILDYMLPGMDGEQVMSVLKSEENTRDIPVHIISAVDDLVNMQDFGVVGQLAKPVKRSDILAVLELLKSVGSEHEDHLLLVEDDDNDLHALRTLFKGEAIRISTAQTGKEAIQMVRQQRFSAMIMDLGLPDMTGFELLEVLAQDKEGYIPPIIVHTGKELSDAEYLELQGVTEAIIIKSALSPERLQDEVHLFIDAIHNSSKQDVDNVVSVDASNLVGKEVLLVDDDIRNTFALAKVIRKKGLIVHVAPSGQDALNLLKHQKADIVLMDIMMPEMDGYEAIGHIRSQKKHLNLPIIALTANAMEGDKEKCLEAGASDYLTKPVDVKKLLVMMQMWL